MLKETAASESSAVIPEKNCKELQSSMDIFVLNALTTFIITAVVTFASVWVAVKYTQHNNEKQEKLTVLRLLEIAESDLKVIISRIDNIGKAQINTDDIKGSIIPFGNFPDAILPYPMIFTDVMTDKRVILNLSKTNLLIFYPSEKQLDKYADAIMRMKYNSALKEVHYYNYRNELKFLQLVLSGEIKHQKSQLDEEQIVKNNKCFESEARKDSPFKNHFDFNNGAGNGSLAKQ